MVCTEEEKKKGEEHEKELNEKIKNMSFDERIKNALDAKLDGNNDFKNKDYENGINKYKAGLKYIKDMENKNDKIKELEIALFLNLSICYYNMEKYNDAHEYVTKVLNIDKTNKKGMFRLCQIEFNRCSFDVAKEKIHEFLKIYPENIDAKKLLKNVIIKQNEHNKKQKEAFSKIFEKASGLYEDREKEIIQKKKEKYEQDMKKKKENNEEIINFEEWEIQENEKRKKEDEEQKKKQKEKEMEREKEREKNNKKKQNNKKNESISSNTTHNSSDLEIDEEDQKIINETKKMGYCYFKKDIKDDDKKLFEKNIPRKIEEANDIDLNSQKNSNKAISSWNSGGTTYEEKDMTKWVKNKLDYYLKNISFKNTEESDYLNLNNQNEFNLTNLNYPEILPIQYLNKIKINEVKDLLAEAQIVVIRGTKRHIFEFSCNLHVSLYINLPEFHVHKIIVQIKELSSELEAGKTWKNYIFIKKNDKLKIPDKLFDNIYSFVVNDIETQIKKFTEEYSTM
ncbi:chaperone binding protein, putative [Plasmodium berghei]|uniref:Chaperone binding protein, putative n=2 Tax=Plasmodium berghei TaxID=5821 RepID=A0A509AQM6_PLABA|nr:chaperone binding protein, putative [Plasmodium berghei ANKA]CXJ01256.1 chaperone binding protein, putative [Plasmodium berghei]SCL98149.1 chaperone binding protein, putative [Plasmodium berghei]SCM16762.1 chaperone binding protein, putative [Plasmodium berghei]SCM18560.1 chaperone binding protein, putative [Plasmodium berghei]SCN27993.1 chaperone binding protein, putative [Plasmodium berghei]|eukprot:XP_034423646.1 chaperone binding protein, putative [Plasmodium berghei ANKA]